MDDSLILEPAESGISRANSASIVHKRRTDGRAGRTELTESSVGFRSAMDASTASV